MTHHCEIGLCRASLNRSDSKWTVKCCRGYLQQAWIWVVGFGLSWPHKSGSWPPYCGWHSWHSSAASHRAWAAHKLQGWKKVRMRWSHQGQKDRQHDTENKANALTVKDTGLWDVSHGRRLHDVPDDELLDGLVLGDTAGTVGAADGLHMPTALLGTTVIPPLLGL